jgi:spermidine synthase
VINEVLKHPSIETIEYAELDPLLLDLLRHFPTPLTESELNDTRVKIEHVDGRLLVATTGDKYDLILVGITEPSSLQANRFFTQEFFSLAEARLNTGGMLVLRLPGSLDYSSPELKNLNSSIFHTLGSVFSHIRVIPGDGTNLFLSSDSQQMLSINGTQLRERVNQRSLDAEAMVPWHVEQKLHPGWGEWFSRYIEGSSEKINSDFNPVGLFYSVSHWSALYAPSLNELFRQFERISLGTITLVFLVLLLIYYVLFSRMRRFYRVAIPFSIISTGFAGMMFDLLLIFTFQSMFGYLFSWIGLLVASFMAGAAGGAIVITRVLSRISDLLGALIKSELGLVLLSGGFPFVFLAAHHFLGDPRASIFRSLFLAISFLGGFLIGIQFPLANRLCMRKSAGLSATAGLLYAADLLGGWFGGIVGAVLLLPVLGLVGTCITVGLLKLTSLIVLTTQRGLYQSGGAT